MLGHDLEKVAEDFMECGIRNEKIGSKGIRCMLNTLIVYITMHYEIPIFSKKMHRLYTIYAVNTAPAKNRTYYFLPRYSAYYVCTNVLTYWLLVTLNIQTFERHISKSTPHIKHTIEPNRYLLSRSWISHMHM